MTDPAAPMSEAEQKKLRVLAPITTGAVGKALRSCLAEIDRLRAALADARGGAIPPREPTQEMLDAVGPKPPKWDSTPSSKRLRETCDRMRREDWITMYDAALRAAPQAPGVRVPEIEVTKAMTHAGWKALDALDRGRYPAGIHDGMKHVFLTMLAAANHPAGSA